MNAFTLKIIALVSMFIDHIGVVIFPQYFILRVIGRLAFPIFVYLVAEGFRHTRSPGKFLMRLGVFAIISEPFYDWAIVGTIADDFPMGVSFLYNTNIFYTLFLGGAAIVAYDSISKYAKALADEGRSNSSAFVFASSLLPLVLFMAIAVVIDADYDAVGVAFIFIMYVIKSFRLRVVAMALICLWLNINIIEALLLDTRTITTLELALVPATVLATLPVALYNGERGIGWKWFFYAAYPVHLAILALFRLAN